MAVAPPRIKGPHLNALRAFESAGRLKSFAAAADELSVTPGAISQHIKSLEAWAEGELFVRNTRGVVLTALGEELLPQFSIAFDRLSDAVQALRTKSAPNTISIAALPSVAQLWLSEKLGVLRQIAPEIAVSVMALESPPNLAREPYDVALFFSEGPPNRDEVVLFQDYIFPVCAPEVAQRLESIDDLKNENLLHDTTWADDWMRWLSEMTDVPTTGLRGATYSLFSVALEEASNGAGVLMGHEALVGAKLKSGILVAPFEHRCALPQRLMMRTAPAFRETQACQLLLRALNEGTLDL